MGNWPGEKLPLHKASPIGEVAERSEVGGVKIIAITTSKIKVCAMDSINFDFFSSLCYDYGIEEGYR